MIRESDLTVADGETGMRLDAWMHARLPSVARSEIRAACEEGRVELAGRRMDKGMRVRPGWIIRVRELPETSDPAVTPDAGAALNVVYEDADIVVLDKPPGQPVQPLRYGETGTLANALVGRFPETSGLGDQPRMPGLLHRIDAATSGLVLAARNTSAWEQLRDQFRQQTVEKTYMAVVEGVVAAPGRIESMLAHEPARRGRMYVLPEREAPGGERPLRAVTAYTPDASGDGRTLLRVVIFTGVTHQIRCQLAHLGHPIVGDALYGQVASGAGGRMLLHASELLFRHPTGGAEMHIRATVPREFPNLGKSESATTALPDAQP